MSEKRRPLRFWDLAFYAAAMGFSIRWLAQAAAAGPASLPLWVLAMAGFMIPLVVTTAELVGRYPGESGLYGWTRRMLGPFAGFLTGWLYWTCNLPFFSGLLYFILGVLAAAAGPGARHALADPWLFAGLASALAVMVGAAHLMGLGAGKWLTNLGAAAGCLLLVALVAIGLALGFSHGPATDFARASYAPPLTADGAALWATMVFAFGGPEALAFLSDDVEGGVRQILRVLAVVGTLIVLAYLAGTAAMLTILRPEDASRLSGIPDALTLAFSRLGLGSLGPAALILLGATMLGGYSAWFGVAARLPFVIGVDHYFPAVFAARDPRTGAPTTAIVFQVVAVVFLVILGQAGASVKAAYDFLVSMSVISYTLPFVFLFLSYFVVRGETAGGVWVAPGGARGRRLIACVGLAVTTSAIACTLVPSPEAADKPGAVVKLVVASALLIAVGIVIYWQAGRRRTAEAAAP
ncbi:MAG TPA: APC family permease [Caulobacteraceae bacterium]